MDDAAPAAGAAAEKKPRRLLSRIPTSVIVTVLGIALTAWLLPAFTRQWDDRQKAHELKTSLVTEMTAATAAVLVHSREALESPSRQGALARTSVTWQLASIQIEERLRSYFFGTGITDTWHNFSTVVNYTLARLLRRDVEAQLLGPSVRKTFASLQRARVVKDYRESMDFITSDREQRDPFGRSLEYSAVQRELLTLEERIAVRVLAANPTGYSTTTHDLLHDLLPGT